MAITYSQHADLTLADIHALVRWEAANTAARLAIVVTEVDNDKVCKQTDNNSYWVLADYSGPTWVEWTSAGIAAVTSVFGEIGDVSESDANFTAADIANVAAGNIIATDVQAALNELDAEKTPLTHTHVVSQITNAGTAALEDVGVTVGDVPQLEDIGGGVPGLPAVDGSQLTGIDAGGSAITVTDEGGAPLTTDVQSFDFVGAGVTASNVGDDVTITIAPGSAPIDTVFSRTGTVVAAASDYDASLIDNDSSVTGDFVDDALNTLDTDKAESTDARFPTTDEKGALAGTGTPSGSNLYVTADTLAAKTHTLSEITDAGTAAAEDTGTTTGTIPVHTADGELTLDDGSGNTAYLEAYGVYPGNTSTDPFDFGGSTQGTPRLTRFAGIRSNADSVDAGNVIVRGGTASGTNSVGGDIEIYGGTGTTGDGDLRLGGYDNAGTDVPLGGDVRMLKGFTIAEAASAPYTTVAGRGQLWPRSSDGAIMWTDSSDVDHDLTTSGSGTMAIEEEGTPVPNGPHDTMNFIGSGVTAADDGGGVVTVTIAAGSAPIDTVFGRTGTVVAVADDYTAAEVTNVPAGDIAAVTVQAAINELDTDKAAVGHTQVYTTVDGVPTQTLLGRNVAGTGAAVALSTSSARTLLNVQDGSVAAGLSGDNYASSHEADSTAHTAAEIVNTPAGDIVATTVQAAIDELDTDKSATGHGHALSDVSDSGTAAAEDVGVTIGDVVQLVNVGGNPGFPALRGDNLLGIPTGAETFVELTDVDEADYVGHAGEFVKVNAGATGLDFGAVPGGGDMLSTNNLSDVTNAITATQNLSVEVGVDVAAFGHTHLVLSDIDNTSGNGVILGRDTAGAGDSEELTPTEARAVLNVGDGADVEGPASAVDDNIATFNLTTGKLIQDSGVAIGAIATAQGVADAALPKSGGAMTGPITTNSTIDGIDVFVDVTANNDHRGDVTTNPHGVTLAAGTGQIGSGTLNDLNNVVANATLANFAAGQQPVTLDKMADMTGPGFIARDTAGAGIPEELSASEARVLLGVDSLANLNTTLSSSIDEATDARPSDEIVTSGTNVTISGTAPTGADKILVTTSATAAEWQDKPVGGSGPTLTKSITIPDPVSGDEWDVWSPPEAITITGISYWCRGTTPSVPFNVEHGSSPAAMNAIDSTGWTATNTTDVLVDTSFSGGDLTVAAEEAIAVTITAAVTGTNPVLHVDIRYTVD